MRLTVRSTWSRVLTPRWETERSVGLIRGPLPSRSLDWLENVKLGCQASERGTTTA